MSTKYDESTKLWTNVDIQPLSELRETKGQWMWDYLLKHGPKIAQINADTGRQMTFNETRLKAIRAAQNLQKRGIESREKFCFMIENHDDLVSLMLASMGLACPIVPLCPILSKDEISRILAKIRPPVIFCDAKLYDLLKEILNELQLSTKVFTFEHYTDDVESIESLFKETGEENSFVPIKHDLKNDVAAIYCSSGTTGPSKSASISYHYSEFIPRKYEADSVFFSFDTIYWSVSLNPIVDSIYNGTVRVITLRPPSPELQLTIIEKYRVTDISNLPLQTASCIKSDLIHTANLSSVRCIIFYGGKLPQTLVVDIEKYFPNATFETFYGLTELGAVTSQIITSQNLDNGSQLFYGCSIKITDDNGNRCGPNVNGEICVQKDHNFLGYYDDASANAAAIDDEGFFRTGDIGHFDSDGNLFIEDRKKNAMNVFYFDNVLLPSKIEEHLITVAGVKEVCVVGVTVACSAYLPAALIVRDPKSKLNRQIVFNAVAENFPNGLKLRAGIYFVDSIPKTPTGKFVRKKATELAEDFFKVAKENDSDIKQHLLDISDEYRRMI